jgi:hypothetical protein
VWSQRGLWNVDSRQAGLSPADTQGLFLLRAEVNEGKAMTPVDLSLAERRFLYALEREPIQIDQLGTRLRFVERFIFLGFAAYGGQIGRVVLSCTSIGRAWLSAYKHELRRKLPRAEVSAIERDLKR